MELSLNYKFFQQTFEFESKIRQRLYCLFDWFYELESYDYLTKKLNDFLQDNNYNLNHIGWIIYYRNYLLLHILFILILI